MCSKTEEEKKVMSWVPYSSDVGSFMYAMMCNLPDNCYAISLVSKSQSNPGIDHWEAVNRIFRYPKETTDHTLCYNGSYLFIRGYSGYAVLLNGGAISWKTKKKLA